MNNYVLAISIALYLTLDTYVGLYQWVPFLFVCLYIYCVDFAEHNKRTELEGEKNELKSEINQLKEEIDVIEHRYKKLDIEKKELKKEVTELENKVFQYQNAIGRANNYLRSAKASWKHQLYEEFLYKAMDPQCEERGRVYEMMEGIDYCLIKNVNREGFWLDILGVVKSMHVALKASREGVTK